MKPIIISPYMSNIDERVVKAQKAVVDKLRGEIPFIQHLTTKSHDQTLNGLCSYVMSIGYDTALILDIDAIPLSKTAIISTLKLAFDHSAIVGNIQRSNHIENGKHTFVAPSFMGIDLWKWRIYGAPSFTPTYRGDVGEELTYRWEEKGGEILLYMPLGFESAPIESPSWKLDDGMPDYGCGTTFGADQTPISYHAFQISHGRNVDNFLAKCESVINN